MQVEWNDPEDPSKGFQYLYLTASDYQAIWKGAEQPWIKARPVMVGGMIPCCASVALYGQFCNASAPY